MSAARRAPSSRARQAWRCWVSWRVHVDGDDQRRSGERRIVARQTFVRTKRQPPARQRAPAARGVLRRRAVHKTALEEVKRNRGRAEDGRGPQPARIDLAAALGEGCAGGGQLKRAPRARSRATATRCTTTAGTCACRGATPRRRCSSTMRWPSAEVPDVARTVFAQGVCQARDASCRGRAHAAACVCARPGNTAIALNLAEVLFQRGDYERARSHPARQHAAADPDRPVAVAGRGRIEACAGNSGRSQRARQQLVSRFPKSTGGRLPAGASLLTTPRRQRTRDTAAGDGHERRGRCAKRARRAACTWQPWRRRSR